MAGYEIPLNAPVWPFRCNWRQPVDLEYEFLTTVFSSRSGKEQRRARRNEPRVLASSLVSGLSATEQQAVVRFCFEHQVDAVAFPDFARQDMAQVTNNQTLTADHTARWLTAGAAVILRSGDNVQIRHVSGVNNAVIGLATPTTYVGRVTIYPVFYGFFSDDLLARVLASGIVEFDLEIEPTPGLNAPAYRGAAGEMFDGREICPFVLDWRERKMNLRRETKVVDFEVGRISRFNPIKFGTRAYQGRVVCGERSEIDTVAAFFLRCSGRLKEFFLPTGVEDLTVKGVNGAVLTCVATGQTSLSKNRVDRAMTILRKDGTRTYHKVTDYALVGGEAQVTLDPAPAGLAPNAVSVVSWMPLCRFNSDRLVIPHLTTEAARIEVNIQTLEYLPAAD